MSEPAFWRGRRVLVTGHTGFKGSWLCLWLDRLGARVIGYALDPPTRPSLFEEAAVGAGLEASHIHDVRDHERLEAVMRESVPEVVFHLAAQALVLPSYRDPVTTYGTNVMGTVHLLEAVRRTPSVRSVVVVTSDKCYENDERAQGYDEGARLGGHDPYSSSKAAAELVTTAYRRSFFSGPEAAGVASARAGNVVGGGDWSPHRLVPDLLRGFAAGDTVPVRAPEAVRPWQHVLDPLAGYLLLARRLFEAPSAFSGAWNFGPEDEARSVEWVADRLATHWGEGARWARDAAAHAHEAAVLRLDAGKARARLGWTPRWDADQALERTVGWHRAWLAAREREGTAPARAAVVEDLAAYAAAPVDATATA